MWTAHRTDDGVPCTCHLYCNSGTQPSDCNVTEVVYNGSYNWPVGVHGGRTDDGDNQTNVNYYCSVHNEYYIKAPVLIEVNWEKLNCRAKNTERDFGEGTS
jgi:hypothetical protein